MGTLNYPLWKHFWEFIHSCLQNITVHMHDWPVSLCILFAASGINHLSSVFFFSLEQALCSEKSVFQCFFPTWAKHAHIVCIHFHRAIVQGKPSENNVHWFTKCFMPFNRDHTHTTHAHSPHTHHTHITCIHQITDTCHAHSRHTLHTYSRQTAMTGRKHSPSCHLLEL